MQRFPATEENGGATLNIARPFRSTDYVNQKNVEIPVIKSTQSPSSPKSKIPSNSGNGRARSCSGGRNKAPPLSPTAITRKGSCSQNESTADIDKRTRKITHRIAELFSLIKENQSDR